MSKLLILTATLIVGCLLLASHIVGVNSRARCEAQTTVPTEVCLLEATR